jgi:hypothetical protein
MDDIVQIFVVVVALVEAAEIIVVGLCGHAASKALAKQKAEFAKDLVKLENDLKKELEAIHLQFDKDLESLRSHLENKRNISKVRFDIEFAVYRELSSAFFSLNKQVSEMVHPIFGDTYSDEDKERHLLSQRVAYERALDASSALYQSAPFIEQRFFESYEKILGLSQGHILVFGSHIKNGLYADRVSGEALVAQARAASKNISDRLYELNRSIRGYLVDPPLVDSFDGLSGDGVAYGE